MSRSPSPNLLGRYGGIAMAVLAVAGAYNFGRWLFGIDPFAAYRVEGLDPSKEVAIEMRDVDFAIYDEDKLIATCVVAKVGVRRDRMKTELFDVRKGKMTADDGSFEFEAGRAEFERRTNVLSAPEGARVWNADLDLRPEGFSYFQRVKRLRVDGVVRGRFFGGQIVAQNLVFNPVEKTAVAGPLEWKGDLSKYAQDTPGIQANKSKPWDVRGEGYSLKGEVHVFRKGRATDGEVIVFADVVEHNRTTDVVTAVGNVRYFSAKANLVCGKAVIYRKEKRAVLTGDVTMLVKPKEQEKLEEGTIPPFRPIVPESLAAGRPAPPVLQEDRDLDKPLRENTARKYPTQIWAEKIEYWYARGSRRATITGSPQARQDLPGGRWRHVWTNSAQFDVEADKLKLLSSSSKKDTRMKNSIGDDLVAKWLTISTKEEGEDEMEGEGVEGTVVSDDEDLNTRGGTGTTTGGTGGAAKPPLRGRIGG